jgi:hypothetical protein
LQHPSHLLTDPSRVLYAKDSILTLLVFLAVEKPTHNC